MEHQFLAQNSFTCASSSPPMSSSLRFSPFPLIPTKPARRPPIVVPPPPPSAPIFRCRPSPLRRPSLPAFCSAEAASWADLTGTSNDGVGGWFIHKSRIEEPKDERPRFHIVGVGASAAILLAAISYFCSARKGFKLCLTVPFHAIHEKLMTARYESHPDNDVTPIILEAHEVSEAKAEEEVKPKGNASAESGRKQIIVPVATDSIQQEALSVLKKLEIMENDASAGELCTRREYARWLVKANYLERNPKYKMLRRALVGVTVVTAFDDVSLDDPDFWCIQSLAEAGIVLSKLSALSSSSISDNGASRNQEKFHFFPESLISRFDLLNWKALLEYSFSSGFNEKMLRTQVNFLDIGSGDASPQLLLDLMAGDNSMTRRAFGNIRRLQPQKPVTKAQAAVVLSSGRMADAIHLELSGLEAENTSRLQDMEEIRSELIQRGDIQRFWEEKLATEKARLLEVENEVKLILLDLEDEKAAGDASLADVKEKAVLDRLQKLLQSRKDEVDEMYDKLASERANFLSEQQNLERYSAELCCRQDAILEAKLILETEREAIRILRSWVKEEALQMRNRADVLAQAALRWQYNGESEHSETFSAESNDSNVVLESNRKKSIP